MENGMAAVVYVVFLGLVLPKLGDFFFGGGGGEEGGVLRIIVFWGLY